MSLTSGSASLTTWSKETEALGTRVSLCKSIKEHKKLLWITFEEFQERPRWSTTILRLLRADFHSRTCRMTRRLSLVNDRGRIMVREGKKKKNWNQEGSLQSDFLSGNSWPFLSTRLSRALIQKEERTLLSKRKTIQMEQKPFLKNTENSTQFDNVYVLFVKEI